MIKNKIMVTTGLKNSHTLRLLLLLGPLHLLVGCIGIFISHLGQFFVILPHKGSFPHSSIFRFSLRIAVYRPHHVPI